MSRAEVAPGHAPRPAPDNVQARWRGAMPSDPHPITCKPSGAGPCPAGGNFNSPVTLSAILDDAEV